MAYVYKFRISLCELEEYIWREIEISSLSSVAKLGYSVLAAFEAAASHLFYISHDDNRYEIQFEDDFFDDEEVFDPTTCKISSLRLSVGDHLHMKYDYGAGWEFDIKLISITEMKKGAGTHYPFITDGCGTGIIEDASPLELVDYVKQIEKTGELPNYYNYFFNRAMKWDHRTYDIDFANVFFKDIILQFKEAYENPDYNY